MQKEKKRMSRMRRGIRRKNREDGKLPNEIRWHVEPEFAPASASDSASAPVSSSAAYKRHKEYDEKTGKISSNAFTFDSLSLKQHEERTKKPFFTI